MFKCELFTRSLLFISTLCTPNCASAPLESDKNSPGGPWWFLRITALNYTTRTPVHTHRPWIPAASLSGRFTGTNTGSYSWTGFTDVEPGVKKHTITVFKSMLTKCGNTLKILGCWEERRRERGKGAKNMEQPGGVTQTERGGVKDEEGGVLFPEGRRNTSRCLLASCTPHCSVCQHLRHTVHISNILSIYANGNLY